MRPGGLPDSMRLSSSHDSSAACDKWRAFVALDSPLCITYFLVTIRVSDDNHLLNRTLMFSDIGSVLQVAGETNESYRLERVDALIPAYLHEGAGYKLARIKEVWKNDGDHPAIPFVLDDGSAIFDSHCDRDDANADLKLAARF